jgi:hypothetical protein
VVYKGNVLSCQCKMKLHRHMPTREIDGWSLVSIDCNISLLTPRRCWRKASLQLSRNITLIAVGVLYTGIIRKEG